MSPAEDVASELRSFIGRPAAPPKQAPHPVGGAMIRAWCRALGDSLPTYTDDEFAAGTRWGGVIAPATMLQAWTMHDRREVQPLPGLDQAEAELMARLGELGYLQVVATNCEQSYLHPLRPGDQVRSHATITDIAGPKRTGLGEGYFVTTETEYRTGEGRLAGTMLFRTLRYHAEQTSSSPKAPPRPETISSNPTEIVNISIGPSVTETRRFDDVAEGEELPALAIPVTPTLIVAGAIASNDFNVLHHDRDRATAAGAPDIFMNILTTNGLVGRYLTEWAGPDAALERLAIRLGAPNYPYDTFTLTATVLVKRLEHGKKLVDVGLRGANSIGDHVTGSAVLELA